MRLVRKRGGGDCGSAALAAVLRVSYWKVLQEAAIVDPERHGLDGLRYVDLIAIAQRFGVTLTPTRLTPKRRGDLETDEGVLGVRWNDTSERLKKNPEGHFVAVIGGDIVCAELGRWPRALFETRFDCRFCTFLKVTR